MAELTDKIISMIAELKDLSELMISLAYSAFLYNDKAIAQEIMELEEYIDHRRLEFELAVLSLPLNVKGRLGLLRLSYAAEELSDASAKIADIVLKGIPTHPILEQAIEDAEETILMVDVNPNSIFVGKSLSQLALDENIGMHIIAIKRHGKWIFHPRENTVIEAGDKLICSGYHESREKLISLAEGITTKI